METAMKGTISIREEERIKAEDVINSVTLQKNPFEIIENSIKVGFSVSSRHGRKKRGVTLPFKKEERVKNNYVLDMDNIVHSCPKYTYRLMLEGIPCHHIYAAMAFATENSEEISKKIREKYGLGELELRFEGYEREPKDVAGLLRTIEKTGKLKPEGRRKVLFEYKKARI